VESAQVSIVQGDARDLCTRKPSVTLIRDRRKETADGHKRELNRPQTEAAEESRRGRGRGPQSERQRAAEAEAEAEGRRGRDRGRCRGTGIGPEEGEEEGK